MIRRIAGARPRGAFLAVALGLVLLGVAPSPGVAQTYSAFGFAVDRLSVETAPGERHEFTVELARTTEQMALGLMYRTRLAADAGMLFDFDPPRRVSMWMKNTLIPLDMLFIEADGRILSIAADTAPRSLKLIDPGRVVRAVLELPAGTAARLGIGAGDLVRYDWFGPAP
jgi:uncharacterized protein